MSNPRGTELAKIHIGKSQLHMSDQQYRDALWTVCRVRSSADLDQHGRQEMIKYLQSQGVIFTSKKKPVKKSAAAISAAQLRKIYALWQQLATANVVKDGSETALRKWVKNTSKRYHPRRLGYESPEFLDAYAATGVIEQLKSWCVRTNIEVD